MIKGNDNTYIEVKHDLDPPIWASKIRFLPYDSHMRTVCMRVELYGCYWSGKCYLMSRFATSPTRKKTANTTACALTNVGVLVMLTDSNESGFNIIMKIYSKILILVENKPTKMA